MCTRKKSLCWRALFEATRALARPQAGETRHYSIQLWSATVAIWSDLGNFYSALLRTNTYDKSPALYSVQNEAKQSILHTEHTDPCYKAQLWTTTWCWNMLLLTTKNASYPSVSYKYGQIKKPSETGAGSPLAGLHAAQCRTCVTPE